MKKVRKLIALSLLITSVMVLNPIGANAEWRKDSKGWWYSEGNSWARGWRNIDGKWYYFNTNGYMAKNTRIDGYELGEDGAWVFSSAIYPVEKNKFIKTSRENKTDVWYKLNLEEGEGITAVLHPQIDKDYMNISIYDEEGSELDGETLIHNGEYGIVNYKAPERKSIYVKVTGSAGIYYIGFYDQYFNNQASFNDERDFFGSLETAKKVTSGTITRKDENLTDWYRIDVKEGQVLTASITPQIDKDYMNIYIYDKEGSQLDGETLIRNEETGEVSKTASTNATYFIKVSGASGKYDLDVNVE